MSMPDWEWNEMQQVGTDYADLAQVEVYDKRMASFRDVDAENREILNTLMLAKGAHVLEIGCGTGRFSRAAAAAGLVVTAIDVSGMMLEYVRSKTHEEGCCPVQTQHAGFLTMDFPPLKFDAVVSGLALHHLPDAWKAVALRNVHRVLKSEGKFILRDVVFSLRSGEEPEKCFMRFVDSFNGQIRPGAAQHVSREYSTFDWIMEGLLIRAGFTILSAKNCSQELMSYCCVKDGRAS